MTLYDFLAGVQAIADAKPQYRLGHAGDDGYCDCIGLIIGACERNGIDWTGVHGTNWWARHYTDSLMTVTDAEDLALGDIVYKARNPGETGYDLPDRYDKDPDKRDYYHVGVVTSVHPLVIMHCTKSGSVDGVTTDSKLGKWAYKGQLSLIDYGAADKPDEAPVVNGEAIVTAPSGSTVNLRKSPGGSVMQRVPIGTAVEVLAVDKGWARIRVPVEGYMMAEYLDGGAG